MPILATKGAASAQGFGFGGGVGFISATGGTVTECGDYKIHTFTGPGSFVVSKGKGTVDYLVVAGGGGGGGCNRAGGGGAGGYRESKSPTAPWTASPLATSTGIDVVANTYPITVGNGGAGSPGPARSCSTNGSDSVFSTITSTGGGRGVGNEGNPPAPSAGSGGSGGGGGVNGEVTQSGGSGNNPPTSPPQGNRGANGGVGSQAADSGRQPGSPNNNRGGPGGGATQAGVQGPPSACSGGGRGGDGTGTAINPSPTVGTPGPSPLRFYAGGGGGATSYAGPNAPGGDGGGGNGGSPSFSGTDGTINTGGGGAGDVTGTGKAGGSGIIILRYKYK